MATTVIIGAGIIGVSTAYYLSDHQPPSSIHLVEVAPELFSSASGYAGGFLAKDWFSRPAAALGALSYEEHRRLAEANGGREKWGYSSSTSVSYTAAPTEGKETKGRGEDWLQAGTSRAEAAVAVEAEVVDAASGKSPAWLRRVDGDHLERIGEENTTAQVDPLLLCRFFLQECLKRGVRLHHPATVLSVSADILHGELSSVRIADTGTSIETDLPCTRIIVAAGAWSPRVFQSLFHHSKLRLPITSLAGHSLLLKSPRWHSELEANGCHAIYTTHSSGHCPEMYARLGGHLYLAGLNSLTVPLPNIAGGAPVDEKAIEQLKEIAKELLSNRNGNNDLEVVREGLCFRPVTPWGMPIISRIPDSDLGVGMATRPGEDGGVFVAAGHGPWGISMSLGTGLVLAELVQGRPLSADISGLAVRCE